ncbi:MAG TPA: hypothetical protein VJC12_02550 [Candidatus Paceibacterota bacterium]
MVITSDSISTFGASESIVGCWLFVACCWFLVVGGWLLVVGCVLSVVCSLTGGLFFGNTFIFLPSIMLWLMRRL